MELSRSVWCESHLPYDPGATVRVNGPSAGSWYAEVQFDSTGVTAANQASDLWREENNRVGILEASLAAKAFRLDPVGTRVLGAGSTLNAQLGVTELSIVTLSGKLSGTGSGFYFGRVYGGFFFEQETAGSFEVSGYLGPGDICFLNLWAGASTPPIGSELAESTAEVRLTIAPEGVVDRDEVTWNQVRMIFR